MSKYFAPIISGILVLFVGIFVAEFVDLYGRFPIFDKVMHFSGGFITGWILILFLHSELSRAPWIKRAIIIAGGVALVGMFWEFAEYTATALHSYFPTLNNYLYIGSLRDTMWDLATDLIGGFVAFLLLSRKNR